MKDIETSLPAVFNSATYIRRGDGVFNGIFCIGGMGCLYAVISQGATCGENMIACGDFSVSSVRFFE